MGWRLSKVILLLLWFWCAYAVTVRLCLRLTFDGGTSQMSSLCVWHLSGMPGSPRAAGMLGHSPCSLGAFSPSVTSARFLHLGSWLHMAAQSTKQEQPLAEHHFCCSQLVKITYKPARLDSVTEDYTSIGCQPRVILETSQHNISIWWMTSIRFSNVYYPYIFEINPTWT